MAKKVKIKKDYIKWALFVAILAIVVFFLLPIAKKENIDSETNITEITDKSKIAEMGDLVTINYVLRLDNGEVVDTNNEELAKEAGLETYTKGPFKFILGQSNKLPTFDQAIEGLKLGEKKTVIIKPIESVLVLGINMTEKKPRRILHSRLKKFSLEEYENSFQEPAIIDNIVSNIEAAPWPFKILNATDKYILAQIMVRPGESFFIPGQEWKSQVMRTSDRVIEFVQNPKIGLVFDTPYGTAEITNVTISNIYFKHTPEEGKLLKQKLTSGKSQGRTFDFEVLDIREDEFIIRRTNHLAQELANIEVEMLELEKNVKQLQ